MINNLSNLPVILLSICAIAIYITILYITGICVFSKKLDEGRNYSKHTDDDLFINTVGDEVKVLYDRKNENALVLYNHLDVDERQLSWAYIKAYEETKNFDSNHIFYVNMNTKTCAYRNINNMYVKLTNKEFRIKNIPISDDVCVSIFCISKGHSIILFDTKILEQKN